MKSGKVQYTDRAFGQDASHAMRGDIVRGLIELITNADDAYRDCAGPIVIEVVRPSASTGETLVSVRDAAKGLTAEEMEKSLVRVGARRSGFEEGLAVRGNLGRGAKDVAIFGAVEFAAIRNGKYSSLRISRTGDFEFLAEDRAATERDYEHLALSGNENGLTAAVHVRADSKVPKFARLYEALARNIQLRDITASREVLLVDVLGRKRTEQVVRYEPPQSELVVEEECSLPGYPDAIVRLRVELLHEQQEGVPNVESAHGLLIKGRHAVYGNSLFGQERRPGAGRLAGSVVCDYIDTLIRDYDDREERGVTQLDANPFALLSRDRDGLHETHPFFEDLRTVVLRRIAPVLDELEKLHRVTQTEGAELRNALRSLGESLMQDLREDLEEIDEAVPGSEDGGRAGSQNRPPLAIVPPVIRITPGQEKTLTVFISEEIVDDVTDHVVRVDHPWIVEVDEQCSAAKPHKTFPETHVAQLRVIGVALGEASIQIETAGHVATCSVAVAEWEDHSEDVSEFRFEYPKVAVSAGRSRKLRLVAPVSMADVGLVATVDSIDDCISVTSQEVAMRIDAKRGVLVGIVEVHGVEVGSVGHLMAAYGPEVAECKCEVVGLDHPSAMGLEIQIVDRDAPSAARAEVVTGANGLLIQIFGRHSAARAVLGKHTGGGFENEDGPLARLLIAEIVAGAITDHLVELEGMKYREQLNDAAKVLWKRRRVLDKYIARSQRLLGIR